MQRREGTHLNDNNSSLNGRKTALKTNNTITPHKNRIASLEEGGDESNDEMREPHKDKTTLNRGRKKRPKVSSSNGDDDDDIYPQTPPVVLKKSRVTKRSRTPPARYRKD
ncbi:MAG: hypothetical protein AAGG81_04915 [Chlamydiota bacterium]